jgi:poly-gamma-glutamate capsule biosynthesis protein CapA/YwtB (metallophosphatase superfamily)
LIIGAHPHVIQEEEMYKSVPIYYSLGNFIFDQYWEESVRNGLGVHITIQDKKIVDRERVLFENTRHKGTCVKNSTPSGDGVERGSDIIRVQDSIQRY